MSSIYNLLILIFQYNNHIEKGLIKDDEYYQWLIVIDCKQDMDSKTLNQTDRYALLHFITCIDISKLYKTTTVFLFILYNSHLEDWSEGNFNNKCILTHVMIYCLYRGQMFVIICQSLFYPTVLISF